MELAEERVKQVIVMRSDLKMRRGKEIAQGSHASMVFLALAFQKGKEAPPDPDAPGYTREVTLTEEQKAWLYSGRFTKVCVRAESAEELQEIYQKAQEAGLTVHLIIDSGATEFGGVATPTCLAIGPHASRKIDPITGHLKLY